MSQRHRWAVQGLGIHDLVVLARLFSGSVQEVIQEGLMPHMDPAVRILAYQIAAAGNGDATFLPFLEKSIAYCEARMSDGPNFTWMGKDDTEIPEIPQQ